MIIHCEAGLTQTKIKIINSSSYKELTYCSTPSQCYLTNSTLNPVGLQYLYRSPLQEKCTLFCQPHRITAYRETKLLPWQHELMIMRDGYVWFITMVIGSGCLALQSDMTSGKIIPLVLVVSGECVCVHNMPGP